MSRIDQIVELAQYIDTLNKTNPAAGLAVAVKALIDAEQEEEALLKTISASSALSVAPERGLLSASMLAVSVCQHASRVYPGLQPSRPPRPLVA